MAWTIIGVDTHTTTYLLDQETDAETLPVDGGIGSQAICAESADGSGIGRVVYMLNSQLQWVK